MTGVKTKSTELHQFIMEILKICTVLQVKASSMRQAI